MVVGCAVMGSMGRESVCVTNTSGDSAVRSAHGTGSGPTATSVSNCYSEITVTSVSNC